VPRTVKLPAGEVYYEVENPRGQLGFYLVSEGGTSPYRLKIRGPSFCNLSVLPVVARDCLLADIAALLGSLDIVMGEVDR
jgi:NADH-quinone oxidoreductase subunit D